jgi:pimeloyl-ACP methyl ester carboxylesterase
MGVDTHRTCARPPLVLLHGFADTWHTWERVLPELQRRHEVLALTLPGHPGGPPIADGEASAVGFADAVERAMDEAGFATAHLVGNSLGGYLALALAARGRARTVVAVAPAGGWAEGDESYRDTLAMQRSMVTVAMPRFDAGELLLDNALREGWPLDPEKISCPVRVVWGTADRFLPWPAAAERYRREWLPHADWVELDGVGHFPQLEVPLETAQLILGFTSP